MPLNHRVLCCWEFIALTLLDSEMKERGWWEYESKSRRMEKKERLVKERHAAAGRHVLLNVSLLKESSVAGVSGRDHHSISTTNSNHSYSMCTLMRYILP